MRRLFILALVATSACAGSGVQTASTPLPGSNSALRVFIDSLADAPDFVNAHWGILIVDPERGDTLYSRNASKLFMPASNMKILTSATALEQLGPDFRYRTVIAARGQIANGTLNGDLVVVGRGDPSVSDHMRRDAMIPLREMADSLIARGVRHVTGRVIPGGDAFPGSVLGYGWTYDDLESAYSAPTDELLFNEGFSELHVRGGSYPGEPAQIELRPARTTFRVRNNVVTTAPIARSDSVTRQRMSGPRARKDTLTGDVYVEGRIAVGDSAVLEITHRDPGAAYVSALAEALHDRGVTVDGSTSDTLARADTLFTVFSPPLRDILPPLMKPSQNQIAEMLFKTVALEATGVGRGDSARAVVTRQIAAWGVPANEAVVRDGSGLSRYDYISPRTAVRVLDAMRRSPHFKIYYDALPIAGVDGTIRNRMKGTPAERNVHAKTGSVALARSLSGYVTTADNHMLIFSFLANNWTVPVRSVEHVQDAIAARLAGMRLR